MTDDDLQREAWWSGVWAGMAYVYLTLSAMLVLRLPSVGVIDPYPNEWWVPALFAFVGLISAGWGWAAWRQVSDD